MTTVESQVPLWIPSEKARQEARLTHFMQWLRENGHFDAKEYNELWTWSTVSIEAFWVAVWRYFDIQGRTTWDKVLSARSMPGAQWFAGSSLNFADQILRHADDARAHQPAIVFGNEDGGISRLSWGTLKLQVGSVAARLQQLGVGPGDRVAAFLPNVPEAVIAFLATASVGAIWSMCSPEMGANIVLDRFAQIEPKVFIGASDYRYAGKSHDRSEVIAAILGNLPSVETLMLLGTEGSVRRDLFARTVSWEWLTGGTEPLSPIPVAFDHPLWVVYSSGTTGLPKAIVHSHGGVLLHDLVLLALNSDMGPRDIVQLHASTGWMLWNLGVGALTAGSAIALFDGHPTFPDEGALWRFASKAGVTVLGVGAAYFDACLKNDLEPRNIADLSALRSIISTGSPLSSAAHRWIYRTLGPDIWLNQMSGGTDIAGAFVGGVILRPVYEAEMQGRILGCAVYACDDTGAPVEDEVGELVCTAPMPSMPIHFWNDPDDRRYRESYFENSAGVWRHGDWIKITKRDGAIIYGRSDATVNRRGIRIGTAEFYKVLDTLPAVRDSIVVDVEFLNAPSFLYVFVSLEEDQALDEELHREIMGRLRLLSPRHLPDQIVAVPEIPYTLTGKKMEVPLKKLILGNSTIPTSTVENMQNPQSWGWFTDFAKSAPHRSQPVG